jgi:MYXO-CTERM domain-containing protein
MSLRLILVPVVLAALAAPAAAHIQLRYPTQRTSGQKTAHCGGAARGATVTTLQPGATITVRWDETVDHVGHYRISFLADGDEFRYPQNAQETFPETLVDKIVDRKVDGNNGPGDDSYEQVITLPDVECDNCTLQLIQVMTTADPPWAPSSLYYQCADLVLTAGGEGAPDAGPDDGGDGGGGDGGGGGGGGDDDGGASGAAGGCAAGGAGTRTVAITGFFLLALAVRLRRRR